METTMTDTNDDWPPSAGPPAQIDHSYHDRCTDHGCWFFINDICDVCSERYRQPVVCQLAERVARREHLAVVK
jgi:hypothetical protein